MILDFFCFQVVFSLLLLTSKMLGLVKSNSPLSSSCSQNFQSPIQCVLVLIVYIDCLEVRTELLSLVSLFYSFLPLYTLSTFRIFNWYLSKLGKRIWIQSKVKPLMNGPAHNKIIGAAHAAPCYLCHIATLACF